MKQVLYYLKDSNNEFINYDSSKKSITICSFDDCKTFFKSISNVKDRALYYEEFYNNLEIDNYKVKFPLKVVKITINYTEEEVE